MTNNIPYIIQVTAPASEPVTLTEAKLYLRVDGADEDSLITNLIVVARQSAQHYLRRSLITQTWKMAFDGYVPSTIDLMRCPVQSVSSVTIVAKDGSQTVVDVSNYYLSADKSRLCFDIAVMGHLIEIVYIAGFGAAAAVPDAIKQGILMHIAQMYDNRDGGGRDGSGRDATVVGQSSRSLYDSYRSIAL